MPRGDYSHGSHTDRVIKSSCARNAARVVLLEACRRADYGKPETTFTKNQLQETTGLCLKSIREALRFLRAEGSLEPVQGFAGGRGVAVTYRLCPVGQGGEAQPNTGEGEAAVRRAAIEAEFKKDPRLTYGEARARAGY